MGLGPEVEVGAPQHRMQVRPGGRQAPPPIDVAIEGVEALLAVAVDVGGQRMSGLLHGLEEGLKQRAGGRTPLELERALPTPPVVLAGQAGLHPLEVGQAMGPVPRLTAGRSRPTVVVHRVAPLEDHPVDGRRPAQHLAASVVHPATTHSRLGFGLVHPVIEPVPDAHRQGGRHVDDDVGPPVATTGLEHQHAGGRIST